ncbi:hypothetical protein [Streptomyces sp. NPDC086989]|uniref:hypothetical protein n=1 Tax=Streptomyces sp. NPDC086989 TaxID=3365764 RepID=UPI00380DA0FF
MDHVVEAGEVDRVAGPAGRDLPAWERAWWFGMSAATQLDPEGTSNRGLWRTAGGRYVFAWGYEMWETTPERAWARVYRQGKDPSGEPGEGPPGDLALLYELGRFVQQARTAWDPSRAEEGPPPTREEAAAHVDGLRQLMEFIKVQVLRDLRSHRREAAWRVQAFHKTQTEAARFMQLDKSTWTALLTPPKR